MTTIHASTAQTAGPSNKHFSYSLSTTASPEEIWSIWIDVDHWKDWDTGLKDASMEGAFGLGAKGAILSLEDRKSKFSVVAFEEGESYTFKTKLPLGGLLVKRFLTIEKGQTVFTHEVWFTGITKGIFANAFGKKFREMLPEVLENIKSIAEGNGELKMENGENG
ncbi:MAG: SRPBCC family protein [Bacteroidota bacterium]